MSLRKRMQTAWAVLAGKGVGVNEGEGGELERQYARLRLDVQAKNEEIAQLRREYERKEARSKDEVSSAGHEMWASLVRKIVPPLSQLVTLRHMGEMGREVRVADVLKLMGKIEDVLRDQGLDMIGTPGQEAQFDHALHQRMSGGDVRDGDCIRVRFPGFRFGDEIPLKALVSRIGDAQDPETPAVEE